MAEYSWPSREETTVIGKYRINRKDEFSWIEITDTSGEVETIVPYIACLKPGKE